MRAVPRGHSVAGWFDRYARCATMLGIVALTLATGGTATSHPAVLVYGFQPVPGFRAGLLWEALAEGLSGNSLANLETIQVTHDHRFYRLAAGDDSFRDVYLSNVGLAYEPTWRDIRFYAQRFSEEMRILRAEHDVAQCHVVGHSMGGLIARAYIERQDIGAAADDLHAMRDGADVHTLIMLATPNHGCPVASLGEGVSTLGEQLSPGSEFLRALNTVHSVDGRMTSIVPTVRYVSLAGQSCLGCGIRIDRDVCLQSCVQQGLAWGGSDLVVMMASAYLPGAENCAMIGYDHVSMQRAPEVVDLIDRILRGGDVPAAVFSPSVEAYVPP